MNNHLINDDLFNFYNYQYKYLIPPPQQQIAPALSDIYYYPSFNNVSSSSSRTVAPPMDSISVSAPVHSFSNFSTVTKSNSVSHKANADSGSTGEYFALKDIDCVTNVQPCSPAQSISVTVANGQSIRSTHFGALQLPSGHQVTAHIFPDINGSLLSISSFVDLGYKVVYTAQKVEFIFNEFVMFEGLRDVSSRLWMVDLAFFQPNQTKNQHHPPLR